MSNSCDTKIAASITFDGCNPASKGLKSIGYLANFDDVNHAEMSSLKSNNLYTDFILNDGAKLYKIYQAGKTPFTGANTEAQVGNYRTTWNKSLPFIILDNGADVTSNIIDKIANGKFVAVVENAFAGKNGDNSFEIVGLETGLALTEGNAEKYNEDYGGGWSLTLQEQNAPTSGLYVLKTDTETTRALLESKLAV